MIVVLSAEEMFAYIVDWGSKRNIYLIFAGSFIK